MNFSRLEDKASADTLRVYDNITEYIRVIIDIYSSSEIDRMYWLTDREKDFFVSTVICKNNGFDEPTSTDALQIYKKYFNPTVKKVNINDYINKLKKKGWLKYSKINKTMEVPAIFLNLGGENDIMDFNLRYVYKNHDEAD